MSGDRIASLRDPWFTASVGITAATAIAGAPTVTDAQPRIPPR
jgi:hypothetical protein